MPSKPKLSVSFHNFWPGFGAHNFAITRALQDDYDVSIVAAGRDLQISSCFGDDGLPTPRSSRPLRIWWTGEARDPQSQIFDLFFGFRPDMPLMRDRWHRFPLWVNDIDWWDESSPHHVSQLTTNRVIPKDPDRFCSFVYSNDTSVRSEFFLRLDAAHRVDSYGRILNNRGENPKDTKEKVRLLAHHRLGIAFENQIAPGYVTEKLLHVLQSGSVPVYWGAREAFSDFNPEAFIDATAFDTLQDLVDHLIRLDDSADGLDQFRQATPFRDDRIPYEHTMRFFLDRVNDALSGPPDPLTLDALRGRWHPRVPRPGLKMERKFRRFRDRLLGRT
ncbi:glycosyltransferase family 10 domain-containing protein [Tepidamorphus sp. 3E244]|uniref:glycosyltransferase family 10 domain-containing protein n=1 Tax=Tepidamorphus sp. 3E244 TaxID=3385498 RepID=UPI0038FC4A12